MIIIACEGKSELELINHLIKRGIFFAKPEQLLDDRPIHMRQLTDIEAIVNSLDIEEEIHVYRIGDTQRDKYDLSRFKERAKHIHIYKVCTKPEIEILVIIAENKFRDYCKVSHELNVGPKQYVKMTFKNYRSVEKYIEQHDIVQAIKDYKKLKRHNEDELYLADLINQKKGE